jgi:hypothetical protein
MRKLIVEITVAVALLLGGILTGNAEATTLTGGRSAINFSLVQKAGCWLPGNCNIGDYQVCDRRGRCKCKPCPGWYPWREYRPKLP